MRRKTVIAWADIGSHGGIFEFVSGPVAERYPSLMHVFSRPLTPDLVPVKITVLVPEKKERRQK